MGDRCYLQMTFRKSDRPLFAKVNRLGDEWWNDVVEETDELLTVSASECNYALYDELHELAEEHDMSFIGYHGAGGDYGSSKFVGHNGMYHSVDTKHDGDLCVSVDRSMIPIECPNMFRSFIQAEDDVKKLFGIE